MAVARLTAALTTIGALAPVILSALFGVDRVDVLAAELLLAPIAAGGAAAVLFSAHRSRPRAVNLGERAFVAGRDAIVASLIAILSLAQLTELDLPPDISVGLLAVAFLLIATYPVAWLIELARGRWDGQTVNQAVDDVGHRRNDD